ncbi:MAG: metallophosphoesterase, partial [Acutalibacteraceae bacterium]|nr:metallophosphoesterase [Acutalibacteraceae bacterium]
IYEAESNNCDILLFGHTHCSMTEYADGLYIMNPGSAHGYGATYGIVDITPQGVVTNILKVK